MRRNLCVIINLCICAWQWVISPCMCVCVRCLLSGVGGEGWEIICFLIWSYMCAMMRISAQVKIYWLSAEIFTSEVRIYHINLNLYVTLQPELGTWGFLAFKNRLPFDNTLSAQLCLNQFSFRAEVTSEEILKDISSCIHFCISRIAEKRPETVSLNSFSSIHDLIHVSHTWNRA